MRASGPGPKSLQAAQSFQRRGLGVLCACFFVGIRLFWVFFFPIYKTKIKARVGELNFSKKNHPEF